MQSVPPSHYPEDGYLKPSFYDNRLAAQEFGSYPRRGKYHDSGVADCESVHADIPMQTVGKPPYAQGAPAGYQPSTPYDKYNKRAVSNMYDGKKRPESAHHYNEMYEELPDYKRPPSPPPLHSLPSMLDATDNSRDSPISMNQSKTQLINNNVGERSGKKKLNPLYDHLESAMKQKEENEVTRKKWQRSLHCTCLAVLIVCVIALTALIIAILATVAPGMIGGGSNNQGKASPITGEPVNTTKSPEAIMLQTAMEAIRELRSNMSAMKEKYENLQNKYDVLSQILQSSPGENNVSLTAKVANNRIFIQSLQANASIQNGLIDSLQNKIITLEAQNKNSSLRLKSSEELAVRHSIEIAQLERSSQTNFSDVRQQINSLTVKISQTNATSQMQASSLNQVLLAMNSSVYEELMTISKMSGPQGPRGYNGSQGPPGVGDLSTCKYSVKTSTSDVSTPSNSVAPFPLENDLMDWITMGVTCSVENGQTSNLSIRDHASGMKQYVCTCSGHGSSPNHRVCRTHLWQCPRIS
ncbi:uncharacterized protein LOC106171098 isoform X2 [Lingula anatina]|uniref:Uncharacterized protein LOC106171098 isoform X2 n=1 Tax=Lingula anatina TaxID=7574 RepID=A0A1S3J8G8_LINAN|nr:uncharacterized protein LOC106171098 isoform X2 [Lingula anatina]XP_013406693.1 uncharacterized protein LOC106171098 isoform X2 [Lingula anatina]XP_013406694.1 uncharacterized protein LOC106171098 isoform X2 [Lingula anatina]XP_013406695.1 uncharacterized protein LOC106171098 isoform X2 [Lingula anatina]XP_013406696.1 uncharacterized protein LOC106171098 isoform X2 [Lingula anatina]XP_013406697.1 uncharacterized protein LOC106171098 isoform X2 [Lingula anatina]XP_013406698.1 uncharacterize|eukprot:XP_013406691.1 uncharacterized protein LOC106171098 isoform X2 [Lingula anatina]